MTSLTREDLVLSPDASLELFEVLIVAGAPAMGLGLRFGCREGDGQANVDHLRAMWRTADCSLHVPRSDLEQLHRMELNAAKEGDPAIPQPIVTDERKLRQYYIYLLFRYTMSKMLISRTCPHGRPRCSCHTHSTLKDIPPYWVSRARLSAYPSAPPHTEQQPAFAPRGCFPSKTGTGDPHTQASLHQRREEQRTRSRDSEEVWNRKQRATEQRAGPTQAWNQPQATANPSHKFLSAEDDSGSDFE